MTKRKTLNIDEKLDMEINGIVKVWKDKGFNNVRKPDVIRLLVKSYKDNIIYPKRKRKSKEWEFL